MAITAILLIAGVACWAPDSSAQRRPAAQRPAEGLSVDEAFTQARAAMASDNGSRFEQLAGRASEHSLREYVDYWSLRLRLAERRAEPNPALDAEVRKFIAANPGTLVADLARRDWMLNQGRRADWTGVEANSAQWVLQDDAQAQCYQLAARASRGDGVATPARALLSQTRELGEACTTLVETLIRVGQFKRDDVYRQLLTTIELNSTASIRRMATLAGVDSERLELALSRPQRMQGPGGGRELEQISLSRLARQDPDAAFERLGGSGLSGADRQFALAQIAAAAMRKLEPQALGWTRDTVAVKLEGGNRAEVSASMIGDETWVWLARAALRAQDWPLLGNVIRRMSPVAQRDPAWIYWQGRVLAAAGKRDDAEQLWRTIAGQYHFYGQLAGEELGQLTTVPARPSPPTEAELAEPGRNAGLARALEFYRLGLRVEGNREWNFQLRGLSDRQLLAAAEWACRRSILDRCVNTAERTTSEHDFALRFISPFHDELKPFARENNLDPAWIYGLIRQESRFIMDARSSVGASGLMQIMPATGRWIARRLGVSDFRTDQLNELPTNLRFGTYYLRSVQDDLEGSALLASAAYNAGPNRPRNWRSTLPGAVEGAIFAEIIPFAETRDYVKKVLSNATIYASLFSGQPQSLRQRLGTVAPKPASPSELP